LTDRCGLRARGAGSDLEALMAYGAYKQEAEVGSVRSEAVQAGEDEGGAAP